MRNAEASGSVVLRRGRQLGTYQLRALPDAEKLPILAAYLDRFRRDGERWIHTASVEQRSPIESFRGRPPRSLLHLLRRRARAP